MTVRLIASDLDGTLFGSDSRVASRTVEAVNALHERGVVTVAATGRSHFHGIRKATDGGAQLDWFVGSNGGHRVNVATGEFHEQLLFDEDQLQASAAAIREALPGVGFGWEVDDGFLYDDAFLKIVPLFVDGGERFSTTDRYRPGLIGKFFVASPETDVADLIPIVGELVPSGANATTSGVQFLEVTPPGADKGSALQRLCEELQITADEVVAFGDNHNDITMLEWAGRGVAMGNGVAAVKETANAVTRTNDDFGVALVLEELAVELSAEGADYSK